jgi:membrane protease YdiL (CAAX protease family)
MTNTVRASVAQLRTVPPLTACVIGFSLLALPAFALLAETLPIARSPAAELAVQWGVAVLVVGTAVAVENRSFAAVGFRRPAWVDIGYLLGTSAVTLFVFVLTDPLVSALGLPVGDDAGTLATGVGLGLALMGAVTTGVVEEVLFRGYPIERLLEHTDSSLVAGGLTWMAFTVAHTVVWPLGNLLQIAAVAAVLTLVYLRRRTLVPVIGAHVLVWAFAVLGRFYG